MTPLESRVKPWSARSHIFRPLVASGALVLAV
jgi:hypothetical protein